MTPKRMNLTLKIILLLLILAIGGGLFMANTYITKLAQDTAQLKAEVAVSQKQLTTYEQTKTLAESLDYVDGLAAEILPQSEDQSVIVAEISQFAKRSNLSVTQINFDVTESTAKSNAKNTKKGSQVIPKGVDVTPIAVEFTEGASYQDLLDFLTRIEENRRRMQVTAITLTPNPDDRTKLNEVSIAINLYSRPQAVGEQKQ